MFVMERSCHRIGFLKRKVEFDHGAITHTLIEINMITLIFEFLHNVALCLNLMLRNFFLCMLEERREVACSYKKQQIRSTVDLPHDLPHNKLIENYKA